MNIIYEVDNQTLRPINLDSREVYQLEELNFYIPKKHKNLIPFLLIKDSEGKKDILKLSRQETDKIYNIYSIDISNTISLNKGVASIALLCLTNNIEISDSFNICLDFSNFKIGKQISLIEGLNRNLLSMYDKIEKMTKMNIEIYQDIEEALKND